MSRKIKITLGQLQPGNDPAALQATIAATFNGIGRRQGDVEINVRPRGDAPDAELEIPNEPDRIVESQAVASTDQALTSAHDFDRKMAEVRQQPIAAIGEARRGVTDFHKQLAKDGVIAVIVESVKKIPELFG